MNPDHDRKAGCVYRRPDVDVQKLVTVDDDTRQNRLDTAGVWRLGRGWAELGRAAHSFPSRVRLWQFEPIVAERRRRVRNPEVAHDAAIHAAAECSAADSDGWGRRAIGDCAHGFIQPFATYFRLRDLCRGPH